MAKQNMEVQNGGQGEERPLGQVLKTEDGPATKSLDVNVVEATVVDLVEEIIKILREELENYKQARITETVSPWFDKQALRILGEKKIVNGEIQYINGKIQYTNGIKDKLKAIGKLEGTQAQDVLSGFYKITYELSLYTNQPEGWAKSFSYYFTKLLEVVDVLGNVTQEDLKIEFQTRPGKESKTVGVEDLKTLIRDTIAKHKAQLELLNNEAAASPPIASPNNTAGDDVGGGKDAAPDTKETKVVTFAEEVIASLKELSRNFQTKIQNNEITAIAGKLSDIEQQLNTLGEIEKHKTATIFSLSFILGYRLSLSPVTTLQLKQDHLGCYNAIQRLWNTLIESQGIDIKKFKVITTGPINNQVSYTVEFLQSLIQSSIDKLTKEIDTEKATSTKCTKSNTPLYAASGCAISAALLGFTLMKFSKDLLKEFKKWDKDISVNLGRILFLVLVSATIVSLVYYVSQGKPAQGAAVEPNKGQGKGTPPTNVKIIPGPGVEEVGERAGRQG